MPGAAPRGNFADLLRAVKRGDAGAREAMLDRQRGRLRAFVRLHSGPLIRRREAASDLLRSVCSELLQDLPKSEFAGEAAFRNWLLGAAIHKIRERERAWLAEKPAPDSESTAGQERSADADLLRSYVSFATPVQDVRQKARIARIEEAFDELPEHYRRAITLSRIVGLDPAAIGREMDRTDAAVRVLLSRALARLTTLLERGQGEERASGG